MILTTSKIITTEDFTYNITTITNYESNTSTESINYEIQSRIVVTNSTTITQ